MDLSLHRSVDIRCASDNNYDQDSCSCSSELCDKNVADINTNDINLYWNFIDELSIILQYPVIDQINNMDLNPSFVNNLFDGKQFTSTINSAPMSTSNNSSAISSNVASECQANLADKVNATNDPLKLAVQLNATIKVQPTSATQPNAITKVPPKSVQQHPNADAIVSTKKRHPVSRGKDLRLLWQSYNVPSSSTDIDSTSTKSDGNTSKVVKRRKASETSNGRKRPKSTKLAKAAASGSCSTTVSTTTDNCIAFASTNDVPTTTITSVMQTQNFETASTTVDEVQPQQQLIDNEQRYCLCNQVSYGQMIACDNSKCPIEWYHFPCVNLAPDSNVNGEWYCPPCQKSANLF